MFVPIDGTWVSFCVSNDSWKLQHSACEFDMLPKSKIIDAAIGRQPLRKYVPSVEPSPIVLHIAGDCRDELSAVAREANDLNIVSGVENHRGEQDYADRNHRVHTFATLFDVWESRMHEFL